MNPDQKNSDPNPEVDRFTDRLWNATVGVKSRELVGRVDAYFGTAPNSVPSTGSRFELYGSVDDDPFRITPSDLVAVTLLSMSIDRSSTSGILPESALRIEDSSEELAALLAQIPLDRELHTLDADEFDRWLGDRSPGNALYVEVAQLLTPDQFGTTSSDHAKRGMNRPVATSKLLARKRPGLIPIRDSRTSAALGNPKSWWQLWWNALSSEPSGSEIVGCLEEIRSRSGQTHLSLLRVADILLWSS